MASNDLGDRLHRLRRAADQPKIFDAVIARGASSRGGQVQVTIPSFHASVKWPVDFWSPRGDDYPKRGNPAVVALTNSNQIVLVGFMPGTGAGGGARGGVRPGGKTARVSGDIAEGTPREIIDDVVLPIGTANGLLTSLGAPLTSANVEAANVARDSYDSGNPESDHNGPAEERWAADLAHGSEVPTPQMDAAAEQLAAAFDLTWGGSGSATKTFRGYRYQLIYRTAASSPYGNHMNHVHFGIHLA